MIPNNITKEHIIKAIQEIESNGIEKGAHSSTYDVVYNDNRYPPKLVVSLANKYANGTIFPRDSFKGGEGTHAFQLLEGLGFEIDKKITSQSTNMENVKLDFAKWLLKNAPESYNYYLGGSTNSVVERLNEINAFFPEQNFFEIDSSKVDQKIREILFVFSTKERRKNVEFVEYDNQNSNGIPKAVMGKNNYLKFLANKFITPQDNDKKELNYWLFQGNPNIYNITNALKGAHLKSWKVAAHKDSIKIGDKVIIWQSGKNAGCYALAEVISDVGFIDEESYEIQHYISPQKYENTERVKLKIIKYLADSPILWSQIKHLSEFKNFKGGNQGTNFTATKDEYETLVSMAEKTLYSWVKTYKEIVEYLKDKEDDQIGLINVLKEAGCDLFNDQDPKENVIPLEVIDPFTFFCYINKYFVQRLEILQTLARNLNITIPKDDNGIPSTNPQKVWVFPYKYLRKNDEIKRLWSFFNNVISNEVTDDQFSDILNIKGVAHTKISEILFYVDPEKYFPINGPTKPYLEEVFEIDPKFTTFSEYENILSQLRSKTDKPFYQLSHEAWIWNDSQKDQSNDFMEYLKQFSKEDLTTYFSFLFEVLDKFNLEAGDDRLLFSATKNNLAFTIGQRYSWCLFKSNKKGKFGVLSINKIRPESEEFSGNAPYPFYTYLDEANFSQEDRVSIFKGFDQELKRTNKTGYRKHNNHEFEKAVYNKNFRAQFIKTETMISNNVIVNQILYGPPGTGKTYALKQDYFPRYTTRETSITAENNFETVVKGCSWWETIAVALLQLGESKVNDIYNHKWVQKKAELSNSKTVKPTLWGQLQNHTIEACEHVRVKSKQQPLIFNKTEHSTWQIIPEEVENQIPELYELIDKVENFKPNPDKVIERFKFVTFHQSFSYEDFIEGIKPIMPENGEIAEDLGYKIEDGVFKDICIDASNDPDNRYAIFIDEINRGNVSAIFGELITLIEIDKRKGAKNEMYNTLPYSKNSFSVPSNLDIYGTMNTADRSVEALDTALRRRFEFKEMLPDYSVIKNEKVGDFNLSKVLETINQRIELLIDRDHTIGHSYFVNVYTAKALANVFNNKIVPLLQEYFYGDYGKIGLVLGKGFIEKKENKEISFADFKYENSEDFKTPTFVLKQLDSESIIEAVNILLGKKEVQEA